MAPTLRPCPECGRHIQATEGRCPFCDCATPEGFGAFEYPAVGRRMTRAAIAAFGASLALAACGTSTGPGDGAADDARADVMQTPDVPVSAYGLPPPPEDGGVAPPYGIPPRDE
jgi:hypothetical protein